MDSIFACRYQDTLYLDAQDGEDIVTGCHHEDGPEECIGCMNCNLYSPMTSDDDILDWMREADKRDAEALPPIEDSSSYHLRTGDAGENPEEGQEHDAVNHPNHYCQGGIECIEAIRASMSPEGFQDYCKGNVMKYIWRWRDKAGVEDLKKARVYLNWAIESAEEQADYEMMDELDRDREDRET